MVGQFLELSIAAQPLAASFEFYRALGFTSLPVSDSLPDPYIVLFDGAVTIGLHEREQDGALLTFVRPGLRDYVRGLRRLGIDLAYAHLADDEFNRVGFADPTGQPIALLEARTFPPGDWNRQNVAACGDFLEYSLPTESLPKSHEFWRSLGFELTSNGTAPHPWERLVGHGLTLGSARSPLSARAVVPLAASRCPARVSRREGHCGANRKPYRRQGAGLGNTDGARGHGDLSLRERRAVAAATRDGD